MVVVNIWLLVVLGLVAAGAITFVIGIFVGSSLVRSTE